MQIVVFGVMIMDGQIIFRLQLFFKTFVVTCNVVTYNVVRV
jgi:hypothetical protein